MFGLIHESHFGIEKSKSHARELIYWPKMDADIERIIANCELCNKYRNNQLREPMISHGILNERFQIGNLLTNWQKSADLTKLHSHQKYYYDRANSKSLPPLREGDVVCYRKKRCGTKLLVLMCVMNLVVRMWCVMNTACCLEIAATSMKLI